MVETESGMIRRICSEDHDEFGHIEYQTPQGLDVFVCPWHNADGSFDRAAYLEVHGGMRYEVITPNYPNVLRALWWAVKEGRHENPGQAVCSIMDITRYLTATEPEMVEVLLKEFGYRDGREQRTTQDITVASEEGGDDRSSDV